MTVVERVIITKSVLILCDDRTQEVVDFAEVPVFRVIGEDGVESFDIFDQEDDDG